MELIERYVNEVGRYLPDRVRPDILREIRSLLEDTLEDRAREAAKPVDEELTVGVLKEFGSPQQVAASYYKPRYLIGPAFYPAWEKVVRIVLGVLAGLTVVTFAFSFIQPGNINGPAEAFAAWVRAMGGFVSSAFTSLGIITIIFGLMEWFDPRTKPEREEWDPRKLVPVAERGEPFRLTSLILDMSFNLLAIVIYIFYMDRIGIYFLDGGKWSFAPLFSGLISQYLPYMGLLAGLHVALGVWVLQAGSWTRVQRIARIGLRVLTVILLVSILSGGSIVAPAGQMVGLGGATPISEAQAVQLHELADGILRVCLAFGVLGEIIETGKGIYRLMTSR